MNRKYCPHKIIIPLFLLFILAGLVVPVKAQSYQPVGIGTIGSDASGNAAAALF